MERGSFDKGSGVEIPSFCDAIVTRICGRGSAGWVPFSEIDLGPDADGIDPVRCAFIRTAGRTAECAAGRHDRGIAVIQACIVENQPRIIGSRPDQRRLIAVLDAADDARIVEIEVIVARIDLHRAQTALANRVGRLHPVELAALVPATVTAGQEISRFQIATAKRRIGRCLCAVYGLPECLCSRVERAVDDGGFQPQSGFAFGGKRARVDKPQIGKVHERALPIAHIAAALQVPHMHACTQMDTRIAQFRGKNHAPVQAPVPGRQIGAVAGEDPALHDDIGGLVLQRLEIYVLPDRYFQPPSGIEHDRIRQRQLVPATSTIWTDADAGTDCPAAIRA